MAAAAPAGCRWLSSAVVLVAAAAVLGWVLARRRWPRRARRPGVAVVALAATWCSTLVIAWADSVGPQLVLPVGLAVYVVKYQPSLGAS